MANQQNTCENTTPFEFVTVAEAAQILQLSIRQLYKYIFRPEHKGGLKSFLYMGTRRRLLKSDVIAWKFKYYSEENTFEKRRTALKKQLITQ